MEPDSHAVELRKEAFTMALYVAICLLAALTAVSHDTSHIDTFKIVWGTTIGLAAAHWFAFRVSARLVAFGVVRRHDAQVAGAQLAGAGAVAVLSTLPVILFSESIELDVVRYVLAIFIAVVGYAVARASGATMARAVAYAASVLIVASAVAVAKNALAGH